METQQQPLSAEDILKSCLWTKPYPELTYFNVHGETGNWQKLLMAMDRFGQQQASIAVQEEKTAYWKGEREMLLKKIEVLESTLANSVLRDEAAEKMAEALKELQETHDWLWQNCERGSITHTDMFCRNANASTGAIEALAAWNAVKEGGKK